MKTLSFDMNTIDFDAFNTNMLDCGVEYEDEIIAREFDKFRAFHLESEADRGEGNIGTTVEVTWTYGRNDPEVTFTSYEIEE
jgi:hypothetical protein